MKVSFWWGLRFFLNLNLDCSECQTIGTAACMEKVPWRTRNLITSIRKCPIHLFTNNQPDFKFESLPDQAVLKFNLSHFSVITLMLVSLARHSRDPSNCKASVLVSAEIPIVALSPKFCKSSAFIPMQSKDYLGNHIAIPLSASLPPWGWWKGARPACLPFTTSQSQRITLFLKEILLPPSFYWKCPSLLAFRVLSPT